VSWLVRIRGQNGVEIGVGPNLTAMGVSLAGACGVTLHSGGLNFPVSVAVVSTKVGVRMSVLAGFTLK
jgi:hypothetical protein